MNPWPLDDYRIGSPDIAHGVIAKRFHTVFQNRSVNQVDIFGRLLKDFFSGSISS